MDKKYLVRVLVLNTIWVIWIALSIFFGCLIANAYFPDNNVMFIPFSLIFLVFGIGVALVIYKVFFRKKGQPSDKASAAVADGAVKGSTDNADSNVASDSAVKTVDGSNAQADCTNVDNIPSDVDKH